MKTMNFIFCAIGAVFLMASCNSSQQKNTGGNTVEELKLDNRPFVNDPNADKFHFFLNIVDHQATDSSVVYTVKSLFETDTVGLQVEVLNNIPAGVTPQGQPDEENGFIQGAIKLSSIGTESDNLVKALEQIYGLEGTGKMTDATILPLVFSSNNEAVDLTKNTTYSFKLFIENTVGAEAEIFAVLDTYRKSFEISEKDDTFRAQLLSAFTGQ